MSKSTKRRSATIIPFKGCSVPSKPQTKVDRKNSKLEKYPMPFFDPTTDRTWVVQPTGDYTADCKTGMTYDLQFLAACDFSSQWKSLFPVIVADMILAGPSSVSGVMVGFLDVIAVAAIQGMRGPR